MHYILEKCLDQFIIGMAVGIALAAMFTQVEQFGFEETNMCIEGNGSKITLNRTSIEEALQNQLKRVTDDYLSEDAIKNIRIACLVQTYQRHQTRATLVKETWGSRCDLLIFESDQEEGALPSVSFSSLATGTYFWGRTKKALTFMYETYRQKFDWIIRTDQNAYVVLENLRLLVSQYNTNYAVQLGFRRKEHTPEGHISGAGGHVLSKEALRRLVEKGLKDGNLCRTGDDGDVDMEMGRCLYNLGVKILDTRDTLQRWRFFNFDPSKQMPGAPPIVDDNFWKNTYYPYKEGELCCSSSPIAWREVRGDTVGPMEYLLYGLRAVGRPDPLANLTSKNVVYKSQ